MKKLFLIFLALFFLEARQLEDKIYFDNKGKSTIQIGDFYFKSDGSITTPY